MSEFVLDASALLALIHGEPGAERVLSVLDQAAISSVNLAEVVSRLAPAALLICWGLALAGRTRRMVWRYEARGMAFL